MADKCFFIKSESVYMEKQAVSSPPKSLPETKKPGLFQARAFFILIYSP